MSGRASLQALALAPLLVATVGCNPFAIEDCTLLGCTDALEVELTGPLEYPFTLTVSSEGDSRATIVYESAGHRAEWTLALEYRRWRPNGDDCEPECLTATIELDVTS